jgi:hypothetical protein
MQRAGQQLPGPCLHWTAYSPACERPSGGRARHRLRGDDAYRDGPSMVGSRCTTAQSGIGRRSAATEDGEGNRRASSVDPVTQRPTKARPASARHVAVNRSLAQPQALRTARWGSP